MGKKEEKNGRKENVGSYLNCVTNQCQNASFDTKRFFDTFPVVGGSGGGVLLLIIRLRRTPGLGTRFSLNALAKFL